MNALQFATGHLLDCLNMIDGNKDKRGASGQVKQALGTPRSRWDLLWRQSRCVDGRRSRVRQALDGFEVAYLSPGKGGAFFFVWLLIFVRAAWLCRYARYDF